MRSRIFSGPNTRFKPLAGIWLLILTIVLSRQAIAQENCGLKMSQTSGITAVTAKNMQCIAKETSKQQVLAMTFAAWCTPCRAHLPGAIEFARKNDLEFIVVVPEAEGDALTAQAAGLVHKVDSSIRVVVIADSYGTDRGPKYKKFLKEIIPPAFPMIDDYSKYILFDKKGNVVFVSSWKDNRKYNWRVDTAVQNQKILPLLGKN